MKKREGRNEEREGRKKERRNEERVWEGGGLK